MQSKRIWTNARLATMAAGLPGLGIIEDGALAAEGERIVYAGPRSGAPSTDGYEVIDSEGRWVFPGLIDCHTHLVWAGSRAHEFELRLAGASYEEIARAGGGIRSTVNAVRAASEEQLVAETLPRLDALIAEGVTTIEIKSGYGLSVEHELKQLRAARALGLESDAGTLEAGKLCNLSIWDIDRPAELVNAMGLNRLHTRIWRGQ